MNAHTNKLIMAVAMFAIVSVALLGATSAVDAVGEGGPVADGNVTITYQMVGNPSLEKPVPKGAVTLETPEALELTVPMGKEFVEWSTTADVTIDDGKIADLQSDITVTAVLNDIDYTVTFQDSDGIILATQVGIMGTAVTVPEDPTLDGYIFKGWNNGAETVTEIPAISGNVTYIAVYQKDVAIMFVSGSQIVAEMTLSTLDVPDDPIVEGKEFIGWYVNGDADKTPVNPAEYIYGDSDVRFVAEYKDAAPVGPEDPTDEPTEPTESGGDDNTGIYACLAVIAIVVIVGAAIFVWTIKKDKKN